MIAGLSRRKCHWRSRFQKQKTNVHETFFCSLIVASKFHPTPLLLSLLEFVAPSRPFVVYCQYKEVNQEVTSAVTVQAGAILLGNPSLFFSQPLLECYTKLRERGGVINLKLSETWLRNYQVRMAVQGCQSHGNAGEQNIP